MIKRIPLNPDNPLDFKQFLIDWNLQYPWDRYWRKKYHVSFGSAEHRAMRFEDMVMDLMEDKVMKELEEENFHETLTDFFQAELPGEKEVLEKEGKKVVKVSQAQLDRDFEELDISQFND